MINIMLIGCGAYAKSCYVSYFETNKDSKTFSLKICFDRKSESDKIKKRFNNSPLDPIFVFIDNNLDPTATVKLLNQTKNEYNINAVIISTPPEYRMIYLDWALDNNIDILSDKPITGAFGSSVNTAAARLPLENYSKLKSKYEKLVLDGRDQVFDLMVQRRFHPAFKLIKEKTEEVARYTGCGVTHFQSTHADGQWRFPSEIVQENYHGYNQGNGKASHSGYHFFDLFNDIVLNSQRAAGKKDMSIELSTIPTLPVDYVNMLTEDTYNKIWPGQIKNLKNDVETIASRNDEFGEVDCLVMIAVKDKRGLLSAGNLNLLHNSFSGRHWLISNEDLYRANGRLRQELHYFVQGPFQSIHVSSLRGCSKVPKNKRIHDIAQSPRDSLVIEVFRNSGVNNSWKPYEKYTIPMLIPEIGNEDAHLAYARHECINEFIENVVCKKPIGQRRSDILSYDNTVKLCTGIYESIIKSRNNLDSRININLEL